MNVAKFFRPSFLQNTSGGVTAFVVISNLKFYYLFIFCFSDLLFAYYFNYFSKKIQQRKKKTNKETEQ